MEHVAELLGKKARGFKSLVNSPVGLTKFEYTTKLLPAIDAYVLTDKADGERALVVLRDDTATILTGADETTRALGAKLTAPHVLDCEVIGDQIYAFDVLEAAGRSMVHEPYAKRLEALQGIALPDWMHVKEFVQLTTATYQNAINQFYRRKRPYTIDGLIFSGKDRDYGSTAHYKWKPPEQLTIDFLVMAGPADDTATLMVGISREHFQRFGLRFPQNYAELIAGLGLDARATMEKARYFPIPFDNALGVPYRAALKVPHGIPREAIGHVAEMSYSAKSGWVFHKARADRDPELRTGAYYGNNYKVAELTLQSALNPLTLGMLTSISTELMRGFYFRKTDDKYLAVRKFNNFVKDTLIRRHSARSTIDLASGKGQDLAKYLRAGVSNLVMLDIDANALDELLRRRYDDGLRQHRCRELILQADLNAPHNKVATELESRGVEPALSVFCNFALHYMAADAAHLKNICALVAHFLREGGEFVMTALDGELVFGLGDWETELYSIKRANPASHTAFRGYEKVSVRLPCSDEPYVEPLINDLEVDEAFREYGITRMLDGNFSSMLDTFQSRRPDMFARLTDDDKKFIGLYRYAVYKKI